MIEFSKKYLPFIVLIMLTINRTEPATLVKPVDTRNTHILYASHLFLPAEKSELPETGNDISISITEASSIIDKYQFLNAGKQGKIDLETTSIYLIYSKKINERAELRGSIPFYYNWGGFMDKYIEGFHKLFPRGGLRNGGREFGGDNEIHIQYQPGNGGPDINSPFYGVGDPSLYLKLIVLHYNPGISCIIGIKPRAGNKAFINSGTTDAGFSFTADYTAGRYYLYVMSGYSRLFGDGYYSGGLDQVRNYIACAAVGTGVSFYSDFFLSVQLYIHNSLYNTGVTKIDYPTVINSWSVRWRVNDQFKIQFIVDEDPFTYAAADIALSLRGEYSF